MGFPIFNARAEEAILSAQEDLRDALREVDDMEVTDVLSEVIARLDEVLGWEDKS